MKKLPLGKGALLIANAGDELRLYGFIAQAKPYIFIIADGSGRNRPATLNDTHGVLASIFPKKGDIFYTMIQQDKETTANPVYGNINNYLLYNEILNKRASFFSVYMTQIIYNLIEKNIDYIVVNSSEEYNPVNEICRTMAEIAVKLVEKGKGKKIMMYEFPVVRPTAEGINDECIHVELDEEMYKNKLHFVSTYHPSILEDLKLNLRVDIESILKIREMPNGIEEVKPILEQINPDFFRNEYIFPYSTKEANDKPFYELYGEELVRQGIYAQAISYKEHVLPIKEGLRAMLA